MHESHISARNTGSLVAIIVLCSDLIYGASNTYQDAWLAAVLALLFALPLVVLYARLAQLFPGKGLFDMLDNMPGKWPGAVLTALFTWYALHLSALVLRNFSEFTVDIELQNTPRLVIMAAILAVSACLSVCTFKTMGRWALIVLVLVAFNLLFTLLITAGAMQLSNLLPVFRHSVRDIALDAASIASVAFEETVLVLLVFSAFPPSRSPYRAYLGGILLGGGLVLVAILRNIMVLGGNMFNASIFPSYSTVRIGQVGSFLEHIESVISFNQIFLGMTKIALCLKCACTGIARLLKLSDEKRLIAPVCLLSLALCATSFESMQELLQFVQAYRVYAPIFAVVLPLILWISAEAHAQKSRANHPRA